MINKWYIVLELICYFVLFFLYGYLCKIFIIDGLFCLFLKWLDYEFWVYVFIYFRGSNNVYFKDMNNVYFFFDMYFGFCYFFKVIYFEMKCVYIIVDDICVFIFIVLCGVIYFEYKMVRLRLMFLYFIE